MNEQRRTIPRGHTALAAALLALAGLSVAPAGAAAPPCGATIADGAIVAHTQAGPVPVSDLIPAEERVPLEVWLSTTGTVTVTIDFECIGWMELQVTHQGEPTTVPESGSDLPHTSEWEPNCDSGTVSEDIWIGFEAGEYRFTLIWDGCDGGSGYEERIILIGDPPLPL